MLTLLQKLYGPTEAYAKKTFVEFLSSVTSGLDVDVRFIGKNKRNWIQLNVSGIDSKVVESYLYKKFGLVPSLEDIHIQLVLNGKIIDSGKVGYGVYVDVGLSDSHILDVLIPMYRLRSHLVDGRKLALRKIIDIFCLQDNFPLSIHLTELDLENKKIMGELSDRQIKLFRGWLSSRLDRVIVLGTYYKQVMFALRQSGIQHYIAKVEKLGFLENSIVCKHGTDAPGVIKAIGRYLPEVPLYVFSPSKINDELDNLPSHIA